MLDELCIILRLKDATQTYADSIGKNVNDLNAFQRSQAVANDVLTQTEEKYSKILAISDPQANQFNQFGKSFDDLVNTIKKGINTHRKRRNEGMREMKKEKNNEMQQNEIRKE